MSKQVFRDGSVLLTGKEFTIALEAVVNHRGAYDIDCSFCEHEDEEEYCEGCTIADTDHCCSCHISPPCSKCVGSKFEVSPYLINYIQHKNGRKRWQCFKASADVFNKLKLIEEADLHLSAEILTTNEAAMYVSSNHDEPDLEVEVCPRNEFKQVMCKMILELDINKCLASAEELKVNGLAIK